MNETARPGLAYNLLAIFVSFLVLCVFTVGFVRYEVTQNNKKFCATLSAITKPRPMPPSNPNVQPSTQYGEDLKTYNDKVAVYNRQVAAELVNLSKQYKCKPRVKEPVK